MFHIEDKFEDLNEHLPHDYPEGVHMANCLENEISSSAFALKGMYWEMEAFSSCDIKGRFRFVDGIEEMDEQALEVVQAVLRDVCFDFQSTIRQLTKYDRVDLD